MTHIKRLGYAMTPAEAVFALAQGNVGATIVLDWIILLENQIDPGCRSGHYFLTLDYYGIYGSDIWVLYKDVCKHSIENVFAVLRYASFEPGSHTKESIMDPNKELAIR